MTTVPWRSGENARANPPLKSLADRLTQLSPTPSCQHEFHPPPRCLHDKLENLGETFVETINMYVENNDPDTASFHEVYRIDIAGDFHMSVSNIVVMQQLTSYKLKPYDGATFVDQHGEIVQMTRLNLVEMLRLLRHYGAEHNKQKFGAVMIRNLNFGAALSIFATRRMICTGCHNMPQAMKILEFGANRLFDIDMCPEMKELPPPEICNIVLSGEFPNRICLHVMLDKYPDRCKVVTNPPGLTVSMPYLDKRSIFVFSTGKITHSGVNNPIEIYEDIKSVYSILCDCQDTKENLKQEATLALKSPNREWSACVIHRPLPNATPA